MDFPRYDENTLRARDKGRAKELPRRLGISADLLAGSRILEIGCGFGETTIALREMFGAETIGIDPNPRYLNMPWGTEKDLFQQSILDADDIGAFDFAHSYTVWEHIEEPFAALQKLYALLRPGGRAYLHYNLYRGASASHLLKYINIPWLQLLYTEEEIRAMMMERHGIDRGPSWVNKLTYAHYLEYFSRIGFVLEKVWYTRYEMPGDFYAAHSEAFKPYPIDELERNFMHACLLKPPAELAGESARA